MLYELCYTENTKITGRCNGVFLMFITGGKMSQRNDIDGAYNDKKIGV